MRSPDAFFTALTAALLLSATAATPVLAAPTGPQRPQAHVPPSLPHQRVTSARCRIHANGEFPEAIAIAPFDLPTGTVTMVNLVSNSGSQQTSLATSAPVNRGQDYVVAVSVGQARSCTASVVR